jgi:phosphatidylethanolamine-binding protein (PEBP) family uncharacterized protein
MAAVLPMRSMAVLVLAIAPSLASQAALAMSASFSWQGIAPCKKISPAFTIKDAPAGTKRLSFVMHDEQAPYFPHGGSTVDFRGATVPQGAIHYTGPCPPEGQTHHYVWTIEALDAKGHVLGKTSAAADFPVK